MIQLTAEQRKAIIAGFPVRLHEPELGQDVVIFSADAIAALGVAGPNGAGQDARRATWQEIFSSKLVVGSAAPAGEDLEVRRDDLLF